MMVKSDRAERELVNELEDKGYAVVRTPASGGRKKSPLPDLVAGKRERKLAVECKSSSDEKVYIEEEEIEKLIEFSVRFGATPLIGARFSYTPWFFLFPHELSVTDGGNFVVEKSEGGLDLSDVE